MTTETPDKQGLRSFVLETGADPLTTRRGIKGASLVVACGLLLWARIIIIADPPRNALAIPEPMPLVIQADAPIEGPSSENAPIEVRDDEIASPAEAATGH